MTQNMLDIMDYFINFNPSPEFELQWIPWLLIGSTVFLGAYLQNKSNHTHNEILKKILQNYPSRFYMLAFLLSLNILARIYQINVFSMRIISYILGIWLFYSLYHLYYNLTVVYPSKKYSYQSKQIKAEQKYYQVKNKKKKSLMKKKRR